MAQQVVVALDWTPNTNHIGFYVSKAKGFFEKQGLHVTFRSPHSDSYHDTPASRLAAKEATFAVCPSETVISYNTWPEPDKRPEIKAVAALLQKDDSAVVTLASSGISSPKELEGKVYASYGARYEGRIVQQMIRADGGSGDYVEQPLPMLGIWNTLLQAKADASWVFLGWEGVEAQQKGVQLNVFKMEDYGIPYGYSPVLAAHPDTLRDQPDLVRSFLAASAEGYKAAAADPQAAASTFLQAVREEHGEEIVKDWDVDFLSKSAEHVSKLLLDDCGHWGAMESRRWDAFLDWLSTNGLLTTRVQSRKPTAGVSTSLDGLRGGDVGEPIPRSSIKAEDIFTPQYLPE